MPNTTSDAGDGCRPVIEAQGLHKRFRRHAVLRGVSLSAARGEVVAVIGPSGSGKSTFLRCLNHLETIDSGRIAIEGEVLAQTDAQGQLPSYASDAEVRRICRKMGMVFQQLRPVPAT